MVKIKLCVSLLLKPFSGNLTEHRLIYPPSKSNKILERFSFRLKKKILHNKSTFCCFVIKSGWGTMNFSGPVSGSSLRKSILKVAPMSQCPNEVHTYETERDLRLCTYFPKVDSCQVDSGGPLLWSDPATGRLNVIGVVSNRFVCAEQTSSAQTRLATVNNMNWIRVILTGKAHQLIC